jgi:aryl-alcohol dehydrogenase-like predicted oxidoreductase
MHFGSRNDEETSIMLLDQYVEAGGTFLDTANAYARWIEGCKGGESEELLGRWLKDRGNREKLFIASKVGFPAPVDDQLFGAGAKQIEHAVEASLRRMGIETIDLYYVHADDRSSPLEERLEAFHKLMKAGKVRFTGASNIMDWRLEEARWIALQNGWTEYCCVQQRYSYIRPRTGAIYDPHATVNEELLDYCRNRGYTILAYSPLLSGAYAREDRSFPEQYGGMDTEMRLKALTEVSREVNATFNQVILSWMLQSDPPVIPLIAASKKEHLRELMDSLSVNLTSDQLEKLSQAGNVHASHPDRQRKIPKGAKQG